MTANRRMNRWIAVAIVAAILLLAFAFSASAQSNDVKLDLSFENMNSDIRTSWDMPPELLFRGVVFNDTRTKPMTQILKAHLVAGPLTVTVKKDVGGLMYTQPSHINPFTRSITTNIYEDYRGSEKEFEAVGGVRLGIAEIVGGYAIFGLNEQMLQDVAYSSNPQRSDYSREYSGFVAGASVDADMGRFFINGDFRFYPRLTREDTYVRNPGSGSEYTEGWYMDARGLRTGISGGGLIWKSIGAHMSYNFRTVNTDNANRGYYNVAVNERTFWHSIGFGADIRF
jgi:hypothetical protein